MQGRLTQAPHRCTVWLFNFQHINPKKMISVIVTYTVSQGFVDQNKQHIHQFLKDFKELGPSGFQYNVYTKDDNVTFVHHSIYKDEKIQTQVLSVPSFKEFQRLRDESGLNGTHRLEILNIVGSTNEELV
jgi:hypothetical protein